MAKPVISSFESNIIIAEEVLFSQTFTDISNNGTFAINNSGNMEREPLIVITLNNALTELTLTNQTSNIGIVISGSLNAGDVYTIYNDSAYKNNVEVDASFTGIFNLKENCINNFRIALKPVDASIDINFSWQKPSDTKRIEAYVQGFSINETEVATRRPFGGLKKIARDYISTEINYDFSIDKLFYDDYYLNYDKTKRYTIQWQTDNTYDNKINTYDYYLCNCKFTNIGFSYSDNELIKEGVSGNACQLIKLGN